VKDKHTDMAIEEIVDNLDDIKRQIKKLDSKQARNIKFLGESSKKLTAFNTQSKVKI
jgi:Mg2+ and Co2+ transporter CorA